MIRTFYTSLTAHLALPALGDSFGKTVRHLHREARRGREWKGDLQTSAYQPLGLTSAHLAHAHQHLIGVHASVTALKENHVKSTEGRIKAKTKQVNKKNKADEKLGKEMAKVQTKRIALRKTLKSLKTKTHDFKSKHRDVVLLRVDKTIVALKETDIRIKSLKDDRKALATALHQHQRKIASLNSSLVNFNKPVVVPSIAFGTKALFSEQHHLKANGHASHAEWKAAWHAARSAHYYAEGDSHSASGNAFVRAAVRVDGLIDLRVQLPPALAHLADEHTGRIPVFYLRGLCLNHGHDHVVAAIRAHDGNGAAGKPITWRFVRSGMAKPGKPEQWHAHVTVHQPVPVAVRDFSRGSLGVDLNADHVAVVQSSADGNFIRSWRFPLVTYGKTVEQRQDMLRKVAAVIATLAASLNLPLVSEDLDFSEKKAALALQGPRHSRMLSSFAYSAFDAALHSACRRAGIWHQRVNPAYTSLIGRMTYARPLGLSVHAAAAFVIARRAMRQSERLPPTLECELRGDRVTLTRPVERVRHVWSWWRKVAVGLKAARVAQRRAGALAASQRVRSPTLRDGGGALRPSSFVGETVTSFVAKGWDSPSNPAEGLAGARSMPEKAKSVCGRLSKVVTAT